MSRLDIIIFGATGFTGKHAVKELSRISKNYPGMTWAVAGRSQAKLEEILMEMSIKTNKDLSSVKKIIADVRDEKSLKDMCLQCKVLVNCCGPYHHYGEPVVRAAIESRSHYVDVTGEPQFMENIQLLYDKQARDAGVYIISACGFDSIPNDLGVIFLQQNFNGTLNSVVSYLTVIPANGASALVNYGTWESLIYGLAHTHVLSEMRKILYPERLPISKPKLRPRAPLHRIGSRWSLPFLSADASVARRTQRALHAARLARPAQVTTYVTFPSLLVALGAAACSLLLFALSAWRGTRALLLRYPRPCSLGYISRSGPADAAVEGTSFRFELRGEGWPLAGLADEPPVKRVTAKISGWNIYGSTVVALLFSALTILHEKDKMPACGVLTPGYAFRNTNIIHHLNENNLKFEIINKK